MTARRSVRPLLVAIMLSLGAIGVSVALGFWGAAVYGPCARPYAECMGTGHAGRAGGGLVLFILAAVVGFVGIITLLGFFLALVQELRRR